MDSLEVTLFTDAAFANREDQTSQIGFLIILNDKNGSCNIVHYGSQKCRRVTRSVMAAGILGLITG